MDVFRSPDCWRLSLGESFTFFLMRGAGGNHFPQRGGTGAEPPIQIPLQPKQALDDLEPFKPMRRDPAFQCLAKPGRVVAF